MTNILSQNEGQTHYGDLKALRRRNTLRNRHVFRRRKISTPLPNPKTRSYVVVGHYVSPGFHTLKAESSLYSLLAGTLTA